LLNVLLQLANKNGIQNQKKKKKKNCRLTLCIADGGVDNNRGNNGCSTASNPSGATATGFKAPAHRHFEASTGLPARWNLSVQVR
jgi:hypothetical protein